jgi:hypothetical protein
VPARTIGGAQVTPLVPRAHLQVVFLAAVLAAGFGGRRRTSRHVELKIGETKTF